MKFSAIFTLGLATAAIANPVKRDATDVISAIASKVDALQSAVNAWSGGSITPVTSASDDLISTINSGVATVKSGPALSSIDALALTTPVQDLTKQVSAVIQKLIDDKSQVVAAGYGGLVQTSLNAQYTAADNLAKALSAKVPSELADIAATLSSGITDAIQKGIDAYKGVPTGGASTTGAASTTSAGSSETSSASSSETTTGAATTTSAPVIPTSTTAASSPVSTPAGTSTTSSGTSSAPSGTFTGAASKERISFVGGAIAAAALVAAF